MTSSLFICPFVTFAALRKRTVSHAQLMHDKGRSMQDFRRRMWLHELLVEVHTADERAPPVQSRTLGQTFVGSVLHQKPPGATKDLPERIRLDRQGHILPQETNKAMPYKDQSLKVATKRKKKARLGRRRENEKKRRQARSAMTKEPWRTEKSPPGSFIWCCTKTLTQTDFMVLGLYHNMLVFLFPHTFWTFKHDVSLGLYLFRKSLHLCKSDSLQNHDMLCNF